MSDRIPRANPDFKIYLVKRTKMSKVGDTGNMPYLVTVGCSTGTGEQQGESRTL